MEIQNGKGTKAAARTPEVLLANGHCLYTQPYETHNRDKAHLQICDKLLHVISSKEKNYCMM